MGATGGVSMAGLHYKEQIQNECLNLGGVGRLLILRLEA